MKIAASIGAVVLVVLILLYANGYFRSAVRTEGRSHLQGTGQSTESEAERQRLAQEAERLRSAQEAEQQRVAQEERRERAARKADRLATQEEERQRAEQERVDSEKLRLAQDTERQSKAEEGIEARPERKAQEDAEKKKSDDDLKQCIQKAEDAYSASWDRACRQIDSPPKCILPPPVLGRFDGIRRDATDECTRLYSLK